MTEIGGPLQIERRIADEGDTLFALYAEVFGEELASSSRQRWQWQYLDNPGNGPEGPEIWVAREGETILGQYASMPVRLQWCGREVRASWGMDVFVNAQARGRGVGAALFTAWSDFVEVALGLGLTPSSYGLFKKLRYSDVGPVPFYQRVLDPAAVARRRLARLGAAAEPLGRVLGPAVGAVLAMRHPSRVEPAEGITIRRSDDAPGHAYDALWERAGGSFLMCVRRDAAYVRWKYVDCPHRRYTRHEAWRAGQLVGFAVSRHEDHKGLRLGWLIDVFADGGDGPARRALIDAVMTDFVAAGVARAQAFSMHGGLGHDLVSAGFWQAESPMQFCVRAQVDSPGAFERKGEWQVTFGDSDMDR